jgi:hypothetical protein
MKHIENKAAGVVSVVLSLIMGAVMGAYILGVLAPEMTNNTLSAATTQANTDILDSGLSSMGLIALAGLVVVIGFIMKSI